MNYLHRCTLNTQNLKNAREKIAAKMISDDSIDEIIAKIIATAIETESAMIEIAEIGETDVHDQRTKVEEMTKDGTEDPNLETHLCRGSS